VEKIKLDDFTRYKFLSGVKYSPDGENACFAVHEMDTGSNKYLSNLWVYRIKEDKYFRLTSFDQERSFIWLEDGEHILFAGARDQKDRDRKDAGEELTVFYSISINGGEAAPAFRIPKNVSGIRQIDKDTFIFTASYNSARKELDSLNDEEKQAELKRRKEEKDYEVIDEIPFWSNGGGFTNKERTRLCLYHADTGKHECLTDGNINVEDFCLNSGHSKAAFIAMDYEGKMEIENAVYLCDLQSKAVERLTEKESFEYSGLGFIDEDTIICMGSDMKGYGLNQDQAFYLIDIESHKRTPLLEGVHFSLGNSVGGDCRYGNSYAPAMKVEGGYFYFAATEGTSAYLNRIDKSGNVERVIMEDGSVDDCDIYDSKVLFIALRGLRLQELYRLEKSCEVRVTDFNGWLQSDRSVSPLESMRVETAPGVVIDGWVIKPVGYEEGKKYPAIFDIHGGPKTVYGEVFFHEMQYWASSGYFVFFCNPRGSDGRGDEFADIRGRYGTIDYDDLMRFTDAVLDKYTSIDKGRIGVTGGSYGGFMTNWIIGHTDRFAAAASQRSISNWISKFATTDIGYYFVEDQQGGTPWDNQEKLWEHSPLKYADRVKTPTLFLHSDEDYRCWIAEGLQMFTALKFHGVDSRLCMFRGENHELSRSGKPVHRVRRLKEITEWFDRYLK
jgi:dipeptidyl aminopeptidase/acylaminoacyl peptidase